MTVKTVVGLGIYFGLWVAAGRFVYPHRVCAWKYHPAIPEPRVRNRRIATITAVIAILTFSAFLGEMQANSRPWELILDGCVGVVSVVLLPLLPRFSVPVALVLAAFAGLASTATPSSTTATLYVAGARSPRVAVGVACAGALGHAVFALWRPLPGLSYGWWLVIDIVVHAAVLGWGGLIRARAQLLESLRERARRAEAEQGRRVAEARVAERTALAREMHDVLAHRLSLVATYAGALEYRQDVDRARIARAAGIIRDGVRQALDELREVVTVLRDGSDPGDAPQPDLTQLADLVAQSRTVGVGVTVHDDTADLARLPTMISRTGYRVIQEGLTNARKHAPEQPVTLTVDGKPGTGLSLELRNPIAYTDAQLPSSGTGLIGLTERVRLGGGQLDHQITDSGEFRLRASLPWPV